MGLKAVRVNLVRVMLKLVRVIAAMVGGGMVAEEKES